VDNIITLVYRISIYSTTDGRKRTGGKNKKQAMEQGKRERIMRKREKERGEEGERCK
jgi:hypothetical protein